MDKNEILSAAQKEKDRGKEFENKEGIRGVGFAAIATLFISIVFVILYYIARGTINPSYLTISTCLIATSYLYEGLKIKKKSSLIIGIVTIIILVLLMIISISQMFMEA